MRRLSLSLTALLLALPAFAAAKPNVVVFPVEDTTRLHLPAAGQALEVDGVELHAGKAKPRRWDFDAK